MSLVLKNKIIKSFSLSIFAILLGFFCLVGHAQADFGCLEENENNLLKTLRLELQAEQLSTFPSKIISGQSFSANINIKNSGQVDFNYYLKVQNTTGNLCSALKLKALRQSQILQEAYLSDWISSSTALNAGEQENINLSLSLTGSQTGDCSFDLLIKAQQENGAWDDWTILKQGKIETEELGVVLNEILPNPHGNENGLPNGATGEWVELYNRDAQPHDVRNWTISDDSGSKKNIITISDSNTSLSGTIIPAHSWLVVYMNKNIFDNSGAKGKPIDSVYLHDNNGLLIDSYTYYGTDCDGQPTPGDTNRTDLDDCANRSDVPKGKSYARIPDGHGPWIDPVPTPGLPNILEDEQPTSDIDVDINISTTISESTTPDTLTPKESSDNANNNQSPVTENTPSTEAIAPSADSSASPATTPETNDTEKSPEKADNSASPAPVLESAPEVIIETITEENPITSTQTSDNKVDTANQIDDTQTTDAGTSLDQPTPTTEIPPIDSGALVNNTNLNNS